MATAGNRQERLAEGWLAIERNDPLHAEKIATGILRDNAQDTESSRLLGASLLFQGRFPEAIASLTTVLRRVRIRGVGYQLGHCYLATGDAENAIAVLTQEVEVFPDFLEAYNLLAIALAQRSRHPEALSVLASAIKRNPQSAGAYSNMGSVLAEMGRHEDAIPQLQKALELEPGFSQAHNNLGSAYQALGRAEAAADCYRRALQLAPDDFGAHNNLGNVLADAGRHEEAIASYRAALRINPDYAPAYNGLGMVLGNLGRYDEAVEHFQKASALSPNNAEAQVNLGIGYQKLKRFDEAAACHRRAIAIEPRYMEAYVNLGAICLEAGRLDEAAAWYQQALSANPEFAMACTLLGAVYRKQNRIDDAIASHKRALSIDPDLAEAHTHLGVAYQFEKRFEDAIACHRKAISLKPALAEAHANMGAAYQELLRFDEAAACHVAALSLNPRYADAHHNQGVLLRDLGNHEGAVACFERALALNPGHERALSALAWSELTGCFWGNIDERGDALKKAVDERRWVDPFLLLALSHDAGEQRRCAERYAADYASPPAPLCDGGPRHDRIRLAYLSSDFRTHPSAFLMAPLYESHDRSKFETIGVSYGPDDGSDIRKRLQRGFDQFVDVRSKGDADVADLLLRMEVDIAIDLNGYTRLSRSGILARRPAPIQVSYLGYPGTTGAPFIDYIVADRFVLPPEDEAFYSEKVVRLFDGYWCDNPERTTTERASARIDHGLPHDGVVFCCFNNNYKIAPRVFEVWMRLLGRVSGSVLWLLQDNAWAEENLRREARSRGIEPGRLIFAPRMKKDEHLARYGLADLFLDTLPYNAHTTASDALWMGVPVLTCAGKTFPGRVAGSLLHAAGLPELVTFGPEEYESLALALATDPERLREIRGKLARAKRGAPLFDTERFRRQIESAYTTMSETWRQGQLPRSFAVPADA